MATLQELLLSHSLASNCTCCHTTLHELYLYIVVLRTLCTKLWLMVHVLGACAWIIDTRISMVDTIECAGRVLRIGSYIWQLVVCDSYWMMVVLAQWYADSGWARWGWYNIYRHSLQYSLCVLIGGRDNCMLYTYYYPAKYSLKYNGSRMAIGQHTWLNLWITIYGSL